MSGHIRRCSRDHTYTLSMVCPVCGDSTRTAHPPRFSPDDRYGVYRRIAKGWKI
ncbi:MAG TPA: RNA-protein complex protein Nop10 [Methanoregulaceae archaeon]|nr:RNA-protein complex protein Nop10 [Methanoregulaceae archaeon]